MLSRLLLCLLIFASLGIFLIGLPPVAKETNQKPPVSEDVKKNLEENFLPISRRLEEVGQVA